MLDQGFEDDTPRHSPDTLIGVGAGCQPVAYPQRNRLDLAVGCARATCCRGNQEDRRRQGAKRPGAGPGAPDLQHEVVGLLLLEADGAKFIDGPRARCHRLEVERAFFNNCDLHCSLLVQQLVTSCASGMIFELSYVCWTMRSRSIAAFYTAPAASRASEISADSKLRL
jgi:hypothetical protein